MMVAPILTCGGFSSLGEEKSVIMYVNFPLSSAPLEANLMYNKGDFVIAVPGDPSGDSDGVEILPDEGIRSLVLAVDSMLTARGELDENDDGTLNCEW